MPDQKNELLAFLRQGGELMERQITHAAERWQLSPSEMRILLFLDQTPELDTARDVALHCGMSKASVSGNVLKLATRGLLTVDVDLKDRRFQHLNLTEQGTAVLEDCRPLIQQAEEAMLSALTSEEQAKFLAMIETINAMFPQFE